MFQLKFGRESRILFAKVINQADNAAPIFHLWFDCFEYERLTWSINEVKNWKV